MTQAPDPTLLWTIIIGLAIGSFALRFAFIGLMGGRSMPPWLMRHLRYTAVAIIPALVTPLVVWPTPTGGTPSLPHLAVAATVFALGYWTRNVLIAMGSGAIGFLLLFLFSA
ncbi:AzlD domain-containing protein [Phaeobacter gallaeciensis]|uniref:AzlD domain-containing protein n=1 Tax=Phaeobacter gallaeciensis TaxID=60890 RepID=UPI000BBC927A|nr:AzlD domain-containing protein [Phaeobacter gallaeciensis]ATF19653.1 branched-chain amino acid transport protein azlD-like protein [Phaeobacter gallaeciensis]ATF23762.1 branched-chain amino acid transport protein azlD-like protein [Phaeobacter gallaeciensis]